MVKLFYKCNSCEMYILHKKTEIYRPMLECEYKLLNENKMI